MCMIGEDEWDFYARDERRAAKAHRCCECGRTIEIGERHQYARGAMNGYWSAYRTCAHCDAAAEWLVVVCGGWLYEATSMDLRDHVDGEESYLRTAALTRLVRWMKADWRRPDGSLRPVAEVVLQTNRAIDAHRTRHPLAVA